MPQLQLLSALGSSIKCGSRWDTIEKDVKATTSALQPSVATISSFLALYRDNQYLRMRGEMAVCNFCADRGVTRLSCDVYNVLTWPQRLSEEVKRTYCLIVHNKYKFVEDAAAKLEPLVKAAYEKLSNPRQGTWQRDS